MSQARKGGDGPSHHAHTLVTTEHPFPRPQLTATGDSNSSTNGKRQRLGAPKDAHTSRDNLGYVRPEKRKVTVQLACN
jgi:hypothetical protein